MRLGTIMMACGTLLLAGCATVEMSSASVNNGERLLVIRDKGYSFAHLFTLWSGNLTWDAKRQKVNRKVKFFKNHADSAHVYAMAEKIAQRENCELVDVAFANNYNGINPDNLYGLIFIYDMSVSALLRPNGARINTAKEVR